MSDTQRGRFAAALAVLVVISGFAGVAGADGAAALTADARSPPGDVGAASADRPIQAAAAGSTSVQLSPTTASINESRSQTFDLVVSDADGGVGAINAEISVDDADIASIRDMKLEGDPGVETVDIESDGSEVFVRAALMDTADTGEVTVGTLTVEGVGAGSTDLDLSVESLGDEDGDPYTVGGTPGSSLTVQGTADNVDLDITADASTVDVGGEVEYEVRRGDTDALVSARVSLGDERYETGLDGAVAVEITEGMASDADTVTAVASKASTDEVTFRNDSVTLNLGADDAGDSETEAPDDSGTETPDDSGTEAPDDSGTVTPEPGDGPRVALDAASPAVDVGGQRTFDVVATDVDNGVGAIEARIALDSAANAQITGAELAGGAGVSQVDVSDDGTEVVIRGALMDTDDAGTVRVATLTVEGVATGESTLSMSVDSLGDEQGNTYDVSRTPSRTLTVGSAGDGDDDAASGSATVVLSASDLPRGFERASVTVRTDVDASVTDTQAALVSENQLRVVSDSPRTTTVQAVDLAGNVGSIDGQQPIARLTYDARLDADDVDIEVTELVDDEGNDVPGDRIAVAVVGSLFSEPLPGADAADPPADPDGDGLYEDVNGDGNVTFDDAIALSFVQPTELSTDQVAALDFDGDGDLDIDDAVALAFE